MFSMLAGHLLMWTCRFGCNFSLGIHLSWQAGWLLKATPLRMDAKDFVAEPYRMLATAGAFHQAT